MNMKDDNLDGTTGASCIQNEALVPMSSQFGTRAFCLVASVLPAVLSRTSPPDLPCPPRSQITSGKVEHDDFGFNCQCDELYRPGIAAPAAEPSRVCDYFGYGA